MAEDIARALHSWATSLDLVIDEQSQENLSGLNRNIEGVTNACDFLISKLQDLSSAIDEHESARLINRNHSFK